MNAVDEALSSVLAPLGMVQLAVIILLAAAFAYAIWRLVVVRDRQEARALSGLAARRGWTVRRHMARSGNAESSGRGYRIEVSPAGSAGWTCLVTRFLNNAGTTSIRTTEFTDPAVTLATGLIVAGPGLAPREAEAASGFLGSLSGPLGTLLLEKMLGGDAAAATGLVHVPQASGTGVTVFATPGANPAPVAQAYAALASQCQARPMEVEDGLVIIAGTQNLRIRLPTDLTDAERLEAFIDASIAAAGRIANGT